MSELSRTEAPASCLPKLRVLQRALDYHPERGVTETPPISHIRKYLCPDRNHREQNLFGNDGWELY